MIRLNNSDGTYVNPTGNRTLRSAVRWMKIAMPLTSISTVTLSGVYDAAVSNPYWYYFPSLGVYASGDMAVGFSGSSAAEYIAAFYHGRKSTGVTAPPVLGHGGKVNSGANAWGHYSGTISDSTGGFWTVQEIPELTAASSNIRTVLTRVRTN